VASRPVAELEVALEIGAPQVVGLCARLQRARMDRNPKTSTAGPDETTAFEDLPYGAGRRPPSIRIRRRQSLDELLRSLGRMPLAYLDDPVFDRRVGAVWTMPCNRRPILRRRRGELALTRQECVTSRPRDAEALT
jgi:hypothetical protein